jgi:hypothetical protein
VGNAASHLTGKAGALGCYVTRANEPGLHVLSASHVFAPAGAAIQDVIVEPPTGQVGVSPLATLVDFEPLVSNGAPNAFDAAIALPHSRTTAPSSFPLGRNWIVVGRCALPERSEVRAIDVPYGRRRHGRPPTQVLLRR